MRNKKTGWRKWIAFGDNHGNLTDADSQRALLKFLDHYKPDDIIHVGDCFDLPALRSGISSQDSAAYDDLEDDLIAGFKFLELTAPTVYLLGNHEHRLWRVAESHAHGVVRMAAEDMIGRIEEHCRKHRIKLIPYHYEKGIHRLAEGALTFVHGYTANQNSVAQHATHFAGTAKGSTVIMGHLHRLESANGKRHMRAQGYSIGCMADFTRMDYAAHRLATAAWQNAWAFGVYKKDQFVVWTAKRTGGKWLLPTGLEEL